LPETPGEAHRLVLDTLDGRPRGTAVPADERVDESDVRRHVRVS